MEARKIELVQSILSKDNLCLLDDLKSMIEEQQSYELSNDHKKVLDHRRSALKENPELERSWAEVKADIVGH